MAVLARHAPAQSPGAHQRLTLACRPLANSRPDRQELPMADIVNLNQYRKRRERRDAEKAAAENRVRHGRTKVDRQKERRENDKAAKDIEDKRLD
jgi:hypothetical protein